MQANPWQYKLLHFHLSWKVQKVKKLQKLEYLENEKSFSDEVKSIFHSLVEK